MTYKWNYLPISTDQIEASHQLAQDLAAVPSPLRSSSSFL